MPRHRFVPVRLVLPTQPSEWQPCLIGLRNLPLAGDLCLARAHSSQVCEYVHARSPQCTIVTAICSQLASMSHGSVASGIWLSRLSFPSSRNSCLLSSQRSIAPSSSSLSPVRSEILPPLFHLPDNLKRMKMGVEGFDSGSNDARFVLVPDFPSKRHSNLKA